MFKSESLKNDHADFINEGILRQLSSSCSCDGKFSGKLERKENILLNQENIGSGTYLLQGHGSVRERGNLFFSTLFFFGLKQFMKTIKISKHKRKMFTLVMMVSCMTGLFGEKIHLAHSQENYHIGFRDNIFALHYCSKSDYWAVGNSGLILHTSDNGEMWSKIDLKLNRALYDIEFVAESGWIVGEGGLILQTIDGGKTWTEQESDTKNSLMKVAFLNDRQGVIVGDAGTVLWTENGGSIWHHSLLEWMAILPESLLERGIFSVNLYDVFFVDEKHGWIAGDSGIVLFSPDGGINWDVLRIGAFPPLYSLFFRSPLEGWAVGSGGMLICTKDGGGTWQERNVGAGASLYRIKMEGAYGIAIGDVGTVLLTVDKGEKWKIVDLDLPHPVPWLLDVAFGCHASSQEIMLAGQGIAAKYIMKNFEE